MVLKADVAEFWSFQQPRTGAPGHPSSMPLVEAAFDAGRARNETAASRRRRVQVPRKLGQE
jgi:hypothetical protein